MSVKTFVDTNVFVYAVDDGEPRKRDIARRALVAARYGELLLSAQVIGEFYVTVTRKLAEPLSVDLAAEAVEQLCTLHVVPIDAALAKSAIAVSRSSQISYWDALIVGAAMRGGCSVLLTEDLNDGQELGGVRVENPFRGAA
jgi:predicted nucleic acid-binding protein